MYLTLIFKAMIVYASEKCAMITILNQIFNCDNPQRRILSTIQESSPISPAADRLSATVTSPDISMEWSLQASMDEIRSDVDVCEEIVSPVITYESGL